MSEASKARQAIAEAWLAAGALRAKIEEAIERCEELPQDDPVRQRVLSTMQAERRIVAGTERVLYLRTASL
jgi:hypothetical protein